MTKNNGIAITTAKYNGRCSHCGARIQVGKAIVKTTAGKWIHARCPKAVPLSPEQSALDTGYNNERDEFENTIDIDAIWNAVDNGTRKLDGGNSEAARRSK